MPGYTGILSPRTYLSSSLRLQLADSLFKPTFTTIFNTLFSHYDLELVYNGLNMIIKAQSLANLCTNSLYSSGTCMVALLT